MFIVNSSTLWLVTPGTYKKGFCKSVHSICHHDSDPTISNNGKSIMRKAKCVVRIFSVISRILRCLEDENE